MARRKVEVHVFAREMHDGKEETWEFNTHFSKNVAKVQLLFRSCQKLFGRCTGSVPRGWTFEKREEYSDGSLRYTQYKVICTGGATFKTGVKLS